MVRMLPFILVAGLVYADPPVKPVCSAATLGRFWPDEAKDNPKFAAALAPYGFPEICSLSWNGADKSYLWRSATVSVDRLRGEADRKKGARKAARNPTERTATGAVPPTRSK